MRTELFSAAMMSLALTGMMLLPGISVALPAVEATHGDPEAAVSHLEASNWAGYVDDSGIDTVTAVSGTWVEPSVKCSAGDQYTVFWVGIDGAFSPSTTVEQTGTFAQCAGAVASYAAWWEFYPNNPIEVIPGFTVHPGDKITASVTFASAKFTLTIKDGAQSFSKKGTPAGTERNSAECIVERPASNTAILPLANFGRVTFSSCRATIGGVTGGVGSFSEVAEITMGIRSKVLAVPSALGASKSSFSVTFKASS